MLKTLQDVEEWRNQISIDDLRDVAREWVRHLDKKIKAVMGLIDIAVNEENEDEYLIQLRVLTSERYVFQHFFNLEDE